MKVTIKDLLPNPYRDSARYPIHREKVEALKASIRSTGFWDNIVVRKAEGNGHYEIAYGHHRLQALQELIREKVLEEDAALEVCVRKLDDANMIRVMASENSDAYKVSAEIVDSTVRIVRDFLSKQNQTPPDQITASDIAQFLGGTWSEGKVQVALQRLGLFDRGTIRREQLKGLTHSAARSVAREVAKVEKTMTKAKMAQLSDGEEEVTEQERKRVRAQVQQAANHVAQVVADHLRSGGSSGDLRQKSLDAQVEAIPEDAPPEDRQLSTIDAAAAAVSAREFQRKVELLLRYRAYMSQPARDDLTAKLKSLGQWCRETLAQLAE